MMEKINGKLLAQDTHILFFAMRYALGRRTAAPSIVVGYIRRHWDAITDREKDKMCAEIETAIEMDGAGDGCDMETWNEILKLNGWAIAVPKSKEPITEAGPKCQHCGTEEDPYWSRVVPMGYFCVKCGTEWDATTIPVEEHHYDGHGDPEDESC